MSKALSLYPQSFENKLQFDRIRDILKQNCRCNLGIDRVEQLSFSTEAEEIIRWLDQADEAMRIEGSGGGFPKTEFMDMLPVLKGIRVEGSIMQEDELFNFYLSYRTIGRILEFFDSRKEVYPNLYTFGRNQRFYGHFLSHIEVVLDEKGKIRDNASPKLALIRKERRELEDSLRKKIDRILKRAKSNGYSDEGSLPTIRDGRMVIPVFAENKRMINGFVHGESSTGKTVYLEPGEILSINNDIKDLDYQEKREIWKILYDITEQIRPFLEDIRSSYHYLGEIDFIFAKATLAQLLNATRPEVGNDKNQVWNEAYHPLLYLKNKESGKSTVPLNFGLNEENRILLISGPNAGGKSVCLKTVALNQYMLQCGLLVPVREDSHFTIYKKIFLDIGDEQSIENDLSTYSSHLTNMNYFMTHADENTLVLIDEFGSGTDPQFGASIAEAILDNLNRNGEGCFGLITTHYSNLKKFAEDNPGLINGAMLYDIKKLLPLYQLEIGRPGSSFAFEIAQNLGLKQEIIEQAKKKVGFSQVKYEHLLSDLEEQNRIVRKRNNEVDQLKKRLTKSVEEYEELKRFIETDKNNIIKTARAEAQRIINDSRKEVERTIRTIKETKADKKATKKAREELEAYREKYVVEEPGPPQKTHNTANQNLKPGDRVKLVDSGTKGEVISVEGEKVELLIGNLKSRVPITRLEKVGEDRMPKGVTRERKKSLDITEAMTGFSPILDIRGKRPEEAMPVLESFMDKAHMLSFSEVKIIHGKGTGVLKELTRQYLKELPYIESVNDEHADQGGAGVSIVGMK